MDHNPCLKVEINRNTQGRSSPLRRHARLSTASDGGGAAGEETDVGDEVSQSGNGGKTPSTPLTTESTQHQTAKIIEKEPTAHMANQRPHQRKRDDSITLNYYGDSVEVNRLQEIGYVPPTPARDGSCKLHTKQSPRLPAWVWYLLGKSLGIKMHETDKPIFGTFMHMVTLFCAFGFSLTNAWYIAYDIVSNETKQTVMTGLVSITMACYWSALSVYANKLAGKLFMNQNFVDSVRLHTKTIFKLNAAVIMMLLSTAAIIVNFVSTSKTYKGLCVTVGLPVFVCKMRYILRIACSAMALLWNLLVGTVLLSVCRTHTIGIRRFIRELEEDGRMYELYRQGLGPQSPCFFPRERDNYMDGMDSEDEEEGEISPEMDGIPVFSGSYPSYPASLGFPTPGFSSPPLTPTRRVSSRHTSQTSSQSQRHEGNHSHNDQTQRQGCTKSEPAVEAEMANHGTGNFPLEQRPTIVVKEGSIQTMEDMDRISLHSQQEVEVLPLSVGIGVGSGTFNHSTHHLIQPDPPSNNSSQTRPDSPVNSTRVELGSPRQIPSSETVEEAHLSLENLSNGPHVLSNDDILLRYWKISCRLRATSLALQRWLIALIMFVILWSVTFIVYWVKHEATLLGIAEFLLPILILPLVCSAYGEVNNEGRRMLRCICPTEHRMKMMYFLQQQPLEINAFGFAINYSTIVTALAAIGVALSTRLIMDEIHM